MLPWPRFRQNFALNTILYFQKSTVRFPIYPAPTISNYLIMKARDRIYWIKLLVKKVQLKLLLKAEKVTDKNSVKVFNYS